VDLGINGINAIEIKKIITNTPLDSVFGQIFNDIRVGKYIFGICLGFDETSDRKYKKLNRTIFYDYKKCVNVIKEAPISPK
jgi:hypothetical protein